MVTAGLLTTVQDAGRPGLRRLGVPPGGAADPPALRLANLLAGNPPGAAGLEITHAGPSLEVDAPEVRAALAGECAAAVVDAEGGERPVAPWSSLTLRRGDRLRLGRVSTGLRAYLAVAGGIAVPAVLGSAATDLRGGWGGLDGRALRTGDALPLSSTSPPAGGAEVTLEPPPWWPPAAAVRAVPGPQDDRFLPEALDRLTSATWTVTPASDRAGLRLDGPALAHRGEPEIVSDACLPGSVQVPGTGRPIVLLVDGGTTGGYPKIATVASADLGVLGRLRPGAPLRFELVDVATAQRLRRELEAWFAFTAEAVARRRAGAAS